MTFVNLKQPDKHVKEFFAPVLVRYLRKGVAVSTAAGERCRRENSRIKQLSPELIDSLWGDLWVIFSTPASPEKFQKGEAISSFLLRLLTKAKKNGTSYSITPDRILFPVNGNEKIAFCSFINAKMTLPNLRNLVPTGLKNQLNYGLQELWDSLPLTGPLGVADSRRLMKLNHEIIQIQFSDRIQSENPFSGPYFVSNPKGVLENFGSSRLAVETDSETLQEAYVAILSGLFLCAGDHKGLSFIFDRFLMGEWRKPSFIYDELKNKELKIILNIFIELFDPKGKIDWKRISEPLTFNLGAAMIKFRDFFHTRKTESSKASIISRWNYETGSWLSHFIREPTTCEACHRKRLYCLQYQNPAHPQNNGNAFSHLESLKSRYRKKILEV